MRPTGQIEAMDLDHTFRMVLIVGVLLVLPVALYQRVKSQATREPLDRRKEGPFILLTLRPVGVVIMLAVIAYVIDPSYLAWSSWPLPAWVRWFGSGIGAAAGVLLLWSFHALGKNLTDTVVTRREHTLVTDGPYRWVRHPFYDAVALCIVATSLIAANWFILLSGALAFALIVVRTRTEEEQLLARFERKRAGACIRMRRFACDVSTATSGSTDPWTGRSSTEPFRVRPHTRGGRRSTEIDSTGGVRLRESLRA